MSLTLLIDYAPYILILGGITAASWLIKGKEKPTSYLGFTIVFGIPTKWIYIAAFLLPALIV